MHIRKVLIVMYWIALIISPVLIAAAALANLPEGTERIPMHVGFDGAVNRWGAPSELLIVGGIMAGCNALVALCYRFNDVLYNHGLVNGVSRKGALVVYNIIGLFIVGITAWVCWFLTSKL